MSKQATLEQRMTAIEKAVAELQQRLAGGAAPADWLDQVAGSVTDDETFRKILQYGREFRYADRPPDGPDEHP